MCKANIAPDNLRKMPGQGLLLRLVQHLEHPLGRGLCPLHGAKALGNLLQRGGKLLGKQHNGHHYAHGYAVIDDKHAAHHVDNNVGQGVGKGDAGPHHGAQKVGGGLRLLLPLVDLLMGADGVLLKVIGFTGLVVSIALLHHGVELAALLEHLVKMLFTEGGDAGGKPDGERHKDQDNQGQPPVLQQHHHRQGDDLQETHRQGVHNIVDGSTQMGYIVVHPFQDLSGRGVVDIAHRQTADLVRHADAQGAGEIAADHVVQQEHFQIVHAALQQIYRRQHAAAGEQSPGQAAALKGPGPEVVQELYAAAQNFGGHHRAGDDDAADQTGQYQPAVDRPGFPNDAKDHLFVLPALCPGLFFSLFPHLRSPPV